MTYKGKMEHVNIMRSINYIVEDYPEHQRKCTVNNNGRAITSHLISNFSGISDFRDFQV